MPVSEVGEGDDEEQRQQDADGLPLAAREIQPAAGQPQRRQDRKQDPGERPGEQPLVQHPQIQRRVAQRAQGAERVTPGATVEPQPVPLAPEERIAEPERRPRRRGVVRQERQDRDRAAAGQDQSERGPAPDEAPSDQDGRPGGGLQRTDRGRKPQRHAGGHHPDPLVARRAGRRVRPLGSAAHGVGIPRSHQRVEREGERQREGRVVHLAGAHEEDERGDEDQQSRQPGRGATEQAATRQVQQNDGHPGQQRVDQPGCPPPPSRGQQERMAGRILGQPPSLMTHQVRRAEELVELGGRRGQVPPGQDPSVEQLGDRVDVVRVPVEQEHGQDGARAERGETQHRGEREVGRGSQPLEPGVERPGDPTLQGQDQHAARGQEAHGPGDLDGDGRTGAARADADRDRYRSDPRRPRPKGQAQQHERDQPESEARRWAHHDSRAVGVAVGFRPARGS